MATDQFTYDVYPELEQTSHGNVWTVWCVDIRLRATGERVHRTIAYNAYEDALDAALDWMEDHADDGEV